MRVQRCDSIVVLIVGWLARLSSDFEGMPCSSVSRDALLIVHRLVVACARRHVQIAAGLCTLALPWCCQPGDRFGLVLNHHCTYPGCLWFIRWPVGARTWQCLQCRVLLFQLLVLVVGLLDWVACGSMRRRSLLATLAEPLGLGTSFGHRWCSDRPCLLGCLDLLRLRKASAREAGFVLIWMHVFQCSRAFAIQVCAARSDVYIMLLPVLCWPNPL